MFLRRADAEPSMVRLKLERPRLHQQRAVEGMARFSGWLLNKFIARE